MLQQKIHYLLILGLTILVVVFFPIHQANAITNQFDFTTSNIVYQSSISPNGANVGYAVTAMSNGNTVSTISCNPTSGSLFPVGNTPVLCSATDNQGTSGSASFIITVGGTDRFPPSIISPANVTAYKTGTYTNVTLGTPQVNDNADPSPLVSDNHPKAGFPLGTTLVTWTATDHSGNSATAIQKVTIITYVPLSITAIPSGSLYKTVQAITLSSTDPVTIYLTRDGTTPTILSAKYLNPISISSNTTLKFFGIDSGGIPGNIKTEIYTIDAISPIITRTGSSPVTVQQGSSYADASASATDNRDGNISSSIVMTNPVNPSILGNYTVTYKVSDQAGNAAAPVLRVVKVVSSGTTTNEMQDTTASAGLITYSGRQIHAEYLNSSSVLVGKQIDTIVIKLKKSGTPIGIGTIGIFNTNLSVKKLFGTKDVSTISTSYTDYTFSLPSGQTYQMQAGDRIGFQYTGGDSTTNFVSVMTDRSNTFDGTNSYRTFYTTAWGSSQAEDLYMTLKVTNIISPTGDTTPPVITLTGSSPVTVQRGSTYSDAGATATDNVDGTISASIVKVNPVNTSILGVYTVTYNVSDKAGNAATQVTRTVKVVDTVAPTVTASPPNGLYNTAQFVSLVSSEPSTIYYTINGSTPTVSSPVYNSPVSINSDKTFKFFAKDFAGNSGPVGTATYSIDTMAPVITLNGNAEVQVEYGSSYVDAGATATDNRDGDLTSSIVKVNPVNTSILGAYTVTYNVSDQAGNHASQITRTVDVLDTTPPVITLHGSNPVTVQQSSIYVDAGATAFDNADGNITSSIVTSNPVDTSVISGIFTVTYDVSDKAGNIASQVTRTVYVVSSNDTTSPTLSITSPVNNTSTNTLSVPVSGTADDDTSIQSVKWNVDNGTVSTAAGTANWSFTTSALSVGTHIIYVNATDTAGNVASKHIGITITSTLDTTSPTLSITSPVNNTSTNTLSVPVSGTADDDTSIQSVKWNVDNGTVSTAAGTANWSFTTSALSVGTHIIYVNATDTAGNVASKHIGITISGPIMQDTTASAGLSLYSGRQVHAEYVTNSSTLVGKQMDSIVLKLKKNGSPVGNATIGIFNPNLSVKKLFATKPVNTLTTSYTDYTFSLPSGQRYKIQSGDRIGIKFTGGDSTTNFVSVMTDRTNAFDGTNSYRTYYATTWVSNTNEDLYMTLTLH